MGDLGGMKFCCPRVENVTVWVTFLPVSPPLSVVS